MAHSLAVRPSVGPRTWTVIDEGYRTVAPVEEWLEAHRHLWSPNTVRGYATALAQWWTFLEQRGEAERWREVGVPAVSGFLSWLRNGRTVEHALVAPQDGAVGGDPGGAVGGVDLVLPVAGGRVRGAGRGAAAARGTAPQPGPGPAGPPGLALARRARRRWCGCADTARAGGRRCCCLSEIQAILDGCAVPDAATGDWVGNLRDRLLFALLAETGCRLGEVLGMRISDFVMGRGDTPYVEIVPRLDNANGARVKMMRPRRVYVGNDLERLFADYLTELARRADELGLPLTADDPLLVNLARPPLLGALREGTVRDKVAALRRKGIGPPGWTPHWLRHSHATALLLAGTPEWVVSRRLGHAHVQTTLDLYGWVGEDEALRAAANWKTYTTGWQVPDGR